MSRLDPILTVPVPAGIRLVVFNLDAHRIALPLEDVHRVIRAVAVTPLPQAPTVVLGVIDMEGEVLPVFDLRHRLRLRQRPVTPDDHFVIARLAHRRIALVVDSAAAVIERLHRDIVATTTIIPDPESIGGLIRLDDGIALVHDLERFLSPEEARTLDAALHDQARSR